MTSLTNQIRDLDSILRVMQSFLIVLGKDLSDANKMDMQDSLLDGLGGGGFYFLYKVCLCLNNRKDGGRWYDREGSRSILNSICWGTGDI